MQRLKQKESPQCPNILRLNFIGKKKKKKNTVFICLSTVDKSAACTDGRFHFAVLLLRYNRLCL